VTKVKPQSQQA